MDRSATGERRDERRIRGRHREGGELGGGDPPVGLALAGCDPAARELAAEEVEKHASVRIRPGYEGHALADPDP